MERIKYQENEVQKMMERIYFWEKGGIENGENIFLKKGGIENDGEYFFEKMRYRK